MTSESRPAKRLRRSSNVLSDEEDLHNLSSGLPLRSPAQKSKENSNLKSPKSRTSDHGQKRGSRSISGRSSAKSSPKSSPEKGRKTKKLSVDDPKARSLHNFFSKATEDERWRKRSKTPDIASENEILEDDIVDDDLEENVSQPSTPNLSFTQPRLGSTRNGDITAPGPVRTAHSSSQRFIKPPIPSKLSSHTSNPDDFDDEVSYRPWADRYGPVSIDELAVHKKKILDVQKWFDDVMSGRSRQRILVLKGSAGCGKTATIRLLSESRKFNIVHWQNPTVSEAGASSSSFQFGEFLSRGGEYSALKFDEPDQVNSTGSFERRVLLIEDFPSTLTRSSAGLHSFRTSLLRYAASSDKYQVFGSKTSLETHPPIVLIISETLVNSSTAIYDSFTAHRLLGPELTDNPFVTVIEFNPVAPTFIHKALELVIKKEARVSGRRRIPGTTVLQRLAEVGDVRSAVNSLEFLCSRGDIDADWSGTVATSAKRSSKAGMPLTEMEENALKLVCQRETTLDMFHATGKIVYNKREDPRVHNNQTEPVHAPPDHMLRFHKAKISQVDIEALLNETGTDIQTFISTIHENYVLSCNGDDFVDYYDGCALFLSDSDVLNPDSRTLFRSKNSTRLSQNTVQYGTSDTLRQDEISFQVATRGLLFSLPFPVSRAVPPGARRSDGFKMFYPTSLRLWKPTEEVRDLIRFVSASLFDPSQTSRSGLDAVGGVASWKSRINSFKAVRALSDGDDDLPTHPRNDASEETMVLEILPYTTKIKVAQQEDVAALNKITVLRGIRVPDEESFDDEPDDANSGTARLTQKVEAVHDSLRFNRMKNNNGTSPATPLQVGSRKVQTQTEQQEPSVEKLWIEDDDIEDD